MNLFRIVRNQNIYITDDNINSDGLYFFRLHGKTIALKDYHAKLWFRVPEGKELYIPVDDWYTPVSKPSLKNVGENVWELDMYFDEYLLYPNESVVEGNIVLHLTKCLRLESQVFLVNFIK